MPPEIKLYAGPQLMAASIVAEYALRLGGKKHETLYDYFQGTAPAVRVGVTRHHKGLDAIIKFATEKTRAAVPERVCAPVKTLLLDYVFRGENVPDEERLRVNTHLRTGCVPCWDQFTVLVSLVNIKRF
jgi:hypothetical protein